MRVLLLATLVATTVAQTTPSEILGSSDCTYLAYSPGPATRIDCSGVSRMEDITAAMRKLSASGHTDFTIFYLKGNEHLTHLSQDLLGDVHFKYIAITNNTNLVAIGDILGASKNTVEELDLSNNKISYLPRMESFSLITFKMNGPYLVSIASNALNAVPNLQTIELQQAGQEGQSPPGLIIGEGAFMHLPHLQELNLKDYYPKDHLATKGSFTFNSDSLHTVNLLSTSPIYNAEVGTFGGFNSKTTLSLLLHAPIAIESFYTVFESGSHVKVQEFQPCGCNLAWVKFSSSFLSQASIGCVYGRGDYLRLEEVPDSAFASCPIGKTGK